MSDARRTRSRYPNIWYRETKDGRAYEISFRDASGRRRWRRVPGFDDIDAAVAALAEAQGKARKGEKTAPSGVRFGAVAERYLDSRQFSRLGGWTQKNYRAALDREILPRFAHVKIAAVDPTMIATFIGELERREKRNGSKGRPRRSTIEGILKPMRGVLRQAVKEGLLSASPFTMLDRDDRPAADEEPHEAHEWTDEEIEALLAASRARARSKDARYDYTPFLTVAVKAGLRLGEGLGLDWDDLELTRGAGAINVRRQWTRLRELTPPKAGSRRRVPISDEVVVMLLKLKMATPPDKTGPVFASRTGGRLSHRNVERRGFDAAADDAGIEAVTLHDLRHAYGSRLASKGLTARQIADAMGHKKTSTTELYIQRFNGDQADERIREAMTG